MVFGGIGRRPFTANSAVGSHDAMAGMQRKVILPRDMRIQQDANAACTPSMPQPTIAPKKRAPPSPPLQSEAAPPSSPSTAPGKNVSGTPQNSAVDAAGPAPAAPRIIPRRQPRILRPQALSPNPNMMGFKASSSDTNSIGLPYPSIKSKPTATSPLDVISVSSANQIREQPLMDTFVPSSKLSSRRAGTKKYASLLAPSKEEYPEMDPGVGPDPQIPLDLPTPLQTENTSSSDIPPSMTSSTSTASAVASGTGQSSGSPEEPPAVAKKRPSWASGWGRSSSPSPASQSSLEPGSTKNIITGESLSPGEAKKRGSDSILGAKRGSATLVRPSDAKLAQGSSGAPGGGISNVQIVLRDGDWMLEGHEQEMESLGKSVPGLQTRLSGGVKAEQEHERDLLQRLYSNSSLKTLQKDGVVLTGLVATPSGTLYRSAVWKFTPPKQKSKTDIGRGRDPGGDDGTSSSGADLPFHKFRTGDSVLITRFDSTTSSKKGVKDDSRDLSHMEGAVLELRKGHLLVSLDWKESEQMEATCSIEKGATWRLDQSVRDTTAQRQIEAIQKLASWSDPNAPSEKLIRCILVGSQSAPLLADQPPLWVREAAWREDARAALASQDGLNSSQRRAVAKAMVSSLTLWQGPPGTGKTRTLLALIQVLVGTASKSRGRWRSMGPVLACADTNAAVDNLVEGLLARGMKVVRVGNPAKVRDHLRGVTLEALAETSARGREAVQMRESAKLDLERCKEIRASGDKLEPLVLSRLAELEGRARSDWSRADLALKDAMVDVVDKAQVVCSTCTGAGDFSLSDRIFRVVVVDEATQATEPAVLVPLTRGAQCVVMAGDPKQLPPTVVSQKALRDFSLDVTLFDRISGNGVQPLLLDTQYRMNPGISRFPSTWFYGSRLKDGVSAADKPPPRGLPWPKSNLPVAVIPVEGTEERSNQTREMGPQPPSSSMRGSGARGMSGTQAPQPKFEAAGEGGGDGVSFRNVAEAQIALQAAHALLQVKDVKSAAILTPYKGQVRCLESLLRAHASHFEGLDIIVSSVDGYQGREADVVVFSAVRCNRAGAIGFVADPRRLNVAITRPRRGLVVVGSPSTLEQGSRDWRAYMGWARSEALLLDVLRLPPPPWQPAP